MSLFIGNISSTTKIPDLEDLFNKYGRCKVSLKTNYGFVDFDSVRDAEDALGKCNKKIVAGSEIELKWSDRMNKEKYASRTRRHYSIRRSRSRSRDSRPRRKEDRHRHHRRSYSDKRKYSKDHSDGRNDRKKSRKKSRDSDRSESSKSRSRSRSKSRSRSRSKSSHS